jgi:hypothetical protein
MLSEVRQNGANPLAKPVRVHIKRESGLRVALFRRSQDLPHVRRTSGKPFQAGFLFQDVVELAGAIALWRTM